jgi:hypothetical protein
LPISQSDKIELARPSRTLQKKNLNETRLAPQHDLRRFCSVKQLIFGFGWDDEIIGSVAVHSVFLRKVVGAALFC